MIARVITNECTGNLIDYDYQMLAPRLIMEKLIIGGRIDYQMASLTVKSINVDSVFRRRTTAIMMFVSTLFSKHHLMNLLHQVSYLV